MAHSCNSRFSAYLTDAEVERAKGRAFTSVVENVDKGLVTTHTLAAMRVTTA